MGLPTIICQHRSPKNTFKKNIKKKQTKKQGDLVDAREITTALSILEKIKSNNSLGF